jgi:hypothetical protein
VGKPEGKKRLGRPRHRWVDNIRMDFGEIVSGGMDWICLAEDRYKWRALGFYKMLGSSLVVTEPVASRVVFSSIELVSWLVSQLGRSRPNFPKTLACFDCSQFVVTAITSLPFFSAAGSEREWFC